MYGDTVCAECEVNCRYGRQEAGLCCTVTNLTQLCQLPGLRFNPYRALQNTACSGRAHSLPGGQVMLQFSSCLWEQGHLRGNLAWAGTSCQLVSAQLQTTSCF